MNREFRIEKHYLNFPIKHVKYGTKGSLIHFIIDGNLVRELEVSLAIDEPDFWVFLDVSEFKNAKDIILEFFEPFILSN